MRALKLILAGGVAAAALVSAAPASAQYYPGYGGGYGGNIVGQVINQVLGGGYGGGYNSQAAISQCAAAVTQRINRDYGYGYAGYGGYGGYNPYGYSGGYGNARVLGISRVEPRTGGGLTIRGVATSGVNAGYGGYGYGSAATPDLTFRCKSDYRGFIVDIDVDRAERNYGYNYTPYSGYGSQPYSGYDYSQYGYRRY
jgi:hypothetical protein